MVGKWLAKNRAFILFALLSSTSIYLPMYSCEASTVGLRHMKSVPWYLEAIWVQYVCCDVPKGSNPRNQVHVYWYIVSHYDISLPHHVAHCHPCILRTGFALWGVFRRQKEPFSLWVNADKWNLALGVDLGQRCMWEMYTWLLTRDTQLLLELLGLLSTPNASHGIQTNWKTRRAFYPTDSAVSMSDEIIWQQA